METKLPCGITIGMKSIPASLLQRHGSVCFCAPRSIGKGL